jgi:hypothetical protein
LHESTIRNNVLAEEETMAEQEAAPKQPADAVEDRSFHDLLKAFLGKVVTVVNPESYEDAPVGVQLRVGFYRAKLVGVGTNYLVLATKFVKTGKAKGEEPVKQYLPTDRVKRLSVMKTELILHI